MNNNKIKVLFIFGGIPHYLSILLSHIQRKGIEVLVALPESGKGKTIGAGVHIPERKYTFRTFHLSECTGWYGKPMLKGLHRLIAREQPDILVLLWPYILQLVFDPFLFKTLRKFNVAVLLREIPFQVPPKGKVYEYFKQNPYITENGVYQRNTNLLFLVKQVFLSFIRCAYYSRVTGVLHYAEGKKDIPVSYGVLPDRIWVTFNSPDTDNLLSTYEALKDTEEKERPVRNLIHIGRLVPWKKTDLLLRAVCILTKEFPDINLVIIGDGPQKKELEKLTKELGIEMNVQFAGAIYDSKELGKFLLNADIYVLAGMGGLSINEAMAFGKPVICSVCDGTEKDLVRDGLNGFFFKPDDVSDLAEKIKYLILNPGLVRKMGEESQKIIREKINIQTVTDRFVDAFNKAYAIKNSDASKRNQ